MYSEIYIIALLMRFKINFFNSIFQQVASWFLAQSAASRQYFLTMKNRIISEIEVSHVSSCIELQMHEK